MPENMIVEQLQELRKSSRDQGERMARLEEAVRHISEQLAAIASAKGDAAAVKEVSSRLDSHDERLKEMEQLLQKWKGAFALLGLLGPILYAIANKLIERMIP